MLDTLKSKASVLSLFGLAVLTIGSAAVLNRTRSIVPTDTQAAIGPTIAPNSCFVSYVIPTPTGSPCIGTVNMNLVLDRSSSMNENYCDSKGVCKKKIAWEKEAYLALLKLAREKVIASASKLVAKAEVTSYGAQGNKNGVVDPVEKNRQLGTAYDSRRHTSRLMDLGNLSDYNSLVNAVNSVAYNPNGNGTCTECGIRIGRQQVFGSSIGSRSQVYANILTADGLSNRVWDGTGYLENAPSPTPKWLDENPLNPANLKAVDEAKRGKGVNIDHYVVGYGTGNGINPKTLKDISNTGAAPFYYQNPNADQWASSMVSILENLCKDSTYRSTLK